MALNTSGKSGSNVHKLDDARKERLKSRSATTSGTAKTDALVVALPNTDVDDAPPEKNRRRTDQAVTKGATDNQPSSVNKKADSASSPPKTPRVSNRRFDQVKVDRIKDELARDVYKIDFYQVADKFIEHERYS